MCGIAGIITKKHLQVVENKMQIANEVQSHRGPDNAEFSTYKRGYWNVGLCHQRLSIIDISNNANQPMYYGDKGVIIFNGELYNYQQIKKELESYGYSFNTDSDTEVLLIALHHWGIENALNKFNGMWSFAWFNLEENILYLSRDRLGIKPLYYFIDENTNTLYFSSEMKTILSMSERKFKLNYQKIGEYLQQSLIATSDDTFFHGIKRFPAGHFCKIYLNENHIRFKPVKFWDLSDVEIVRKVNIEEAIHKVRELFIDSVNLRLRSDVPVGVLLSGGIDSSAITAVANNILNGENPITVFSAVSDHKKYDESYFIDKVAEHLNINVVKVKLDFKPEEVISYLEQVSWYNDEPVGSLSNVAHYLLMKKAKELGITVLLSGQGADELLFGYKKYLGFYLQFLLKRKQFSKALSVYMQFRKQGTIINQFSIQEAKRYLPEFLRPKEINILTKDLLLNFEPLHLGISGLKNMSQRQLLDIKKFSIPILTHYEDRMSMAWSREVRVPFLDYRLVEYLYSIPTDFKIKDGWTKYIFRKAIEKELPKEIVWRKDKQGFVNPQSEWLKHELKDTLLSYFHDKNSLIFKSNLIDQEKLILKYEQYCNQEEGKGSIWFKDIFSPLALEIWMRKYERFIEF